MYQKTFTDTTPTTSAEGTSATKYISIGSNIDTVVGINSMINDSGIIKPVPFIPNQQTMVGSGTFFSLTLRVHNNSATSNKNSIRIDINRIGENNKPIIITVQYTKV